MAKSKKYLKLNYDFLKTDKGIFVVPKVCKNKYNNGRKKTTRK